MRFKGLLETPSARIISSASRPFLALAGVTTAGRLMVVLGGVDVWLERADLMLVRGVGVEVCELVCF